MVRFTDPASPAIQSGPAPVPFPVRLPAPTPLPVTLAAPVPVPCPAISGTPTEFCPVSPADPPTRPCVPTCSASRVAAGSRPKSSAVNTAARSCSKLPGAPACCRERAIALIRWSAAIISAGSSSRPASAPFPDISCQLSTRASARPDSARRRAASGSMARTIARSAARSCPVVMSRAGSHIAAATAAAATSPSADSSATNTSALGRSITPADSAAST